jgi:hypothetical protein
MKIRLLHLTMYVSFGLLLLLILTWPAHAQSIPENRLLQALGKDAKIVPEWSLVIKDESAWMQHHAANTETAFTDMKSRTTYVRESYAEKASLSDLRFTLLHEAGHLACNCFVEQVADKFAHAHLN